MSAHIGRTERNRCGHSHSNTRVQMFRTAVQFSSSAVKPNCEIRQWCIADFAPSNLRQMDSVALVRRRVVRGTTN